MSWLFEAKKRYSITILNYMVMDNHIHLLLVDNGDRDSIPKSIQLAAGRTGQEFNHRKKRKGAYWEDRYHATAVDKADYLAQCMDYIDMNMVRAGVVNHPVEWPFCGYHELMSGKQRYRLIDSEKLAELMGGASTEEISATRKRSINTILLKGSSLKRQRKWTESVAVGSESFIDTLKDKLGLRARSRMVHQDNKIYQLREAVDPYNAIFRAQNDVLSTKNALFWKVYPEI